MDVGSVVAVAVAVGIGVSVGASVGMRVGSGTGWVHAITKTQEIAAMDTAIPSRRLIEVMSS